MTLSVIYPTSLTYTAEDSPILNYPTREITGTTDSATLTQKTDIQIPSRSEEVLTSTDETVIEEEDTIQIPHVVTTIPKILPKSEGASVFTVPFYSQFTDITSTEWKKVGCGIASLAMIIDYYKTSTPSVDTLLQEGIDAHAYLNDAGWTYAGLIGISKKYGLTGESHDLASATMDSAFNSLEEALTHGPVMVSVHYKFEPENPIPHLVVADGVHDGMFFYNDPAAETGNLSIPISTFKEAWKKRYIEIRPTS